MCDGGGEGLEEIPLSSLLLSLLPSSFSWLTDWSAGRDISQLPETSNISTASLLCGESEESVYTGCYLVNFNLWNIDITSIIRKLSQSLKDVRPEDHRQSKQREKWDCRHYCHQLGAIAREGEFVYKCRVFNVEGDVLGDGHALRRDITETVGEESVGSVGRVGKW